MSIHSQDDQPVYFPAMTTITINRKTGRGYGSPQGLGRTISLSNLNLGFTRYFVACHYHHYSGS
jgi:hypothetical protein